MGLRVLVSAVSTAVSALPIVTSPFEGKICFYSSFCISSDPAGYLPGLSMGPCLMFANKKTKTVWTWVGVVTVFVALALYVAYRFYTYTPDMQSYASFSDLPLNSWVQVDLGGQTMCSDGSPYHIYVRRGSSPDLIIHFSGGGACWDADTCAQPIRLTNVEGYYFPNLWAIQRAVLNGIFAAKNDENPFKDWSVVYIPYCTADFHIGAVTRTYSVSAGKSMTIHFNGRQNATSALDWAYQNLSQPERLLISGDSAGAFAATLWAPVIAQHFPNSHIFQLSDGSTIVSSRWNEIANYTWQADLQNNFGFDPGDDLTGSAYLAYAQQAGSPITYLQINTLYDGTITRFQAKMNNSDDPDYRETWSQDMTKSMQTTAASGLAYDYYITNYGLDQNSGTTPHTSIPYASFYKVSQDGVTLRDWLQRIVIGDENFSVGSEFLPSN